MWGEKILNKFDKLNNNKFLLTKKKKEATKKAKNNNFYKIQKKNKEWQHKNKLLDAPNNINLEGITKYRTYLLAVSCELDMSAELDSDDHFFNCCEWAEEEPEWEVAERGDRNDMGGAEFRWDAPAMLTFSSALRCDLRSLMGRRAGVRNVGLEGSKTLFCVAAGKKTCMLFFRTL